MREYPPTCTDYHVPEKIKVAKTVTPDRPIKSFNAWIQWVYKTVKKQAA